MKIFCAWLGRFFAFILYHLPRPIQFFLGDLIGILWLDILRIRRDIVKNNFDIAFPEWENEKKWKMARNSMSYLGRGLVQYSYLPFLNKNNIKQYVKFKNIHFLEQALEQEKGVCMLTLHLGNGDMGIAALSLADYPIELISKEFKIRWLNELWFGMRERLGTKFIPPRNSSYSILKALKKNSIVVFVLDQFMGPPIGIKTKFFGKETGTAMGLTVMAKRTGAPVLPVYIYWNEDGTHTVEVEPAIVFEEMSTKEKTLKHMTQVYTDHIERIIRKHPDQWMWVHRRWKKFKVES